MVTSDETVSRELWQLLGGEDRAHGALRITGDAPSLPTPFHVASLAAASVGVATLAAAELWAARTGGSLRGAQVNRGHATAAFRFERYMAAEGWQLPPVWDPIAGDYEAADGWVRLHTNYTWHRDAATAALGVPAEKSAVAAAVRALPASEVEAAVVGRGGCAAALRSLEAWKEHPQGKAVATEPLIAFGARSSREDARLRGDVAAPLAGLRVLDLTRVIAGPVCSRFLAAYGADVLRLDPPAFDEVGALLPEMTRGKRCAFLDLKSPEGKRMFDGLLQEADILVHGYHLGVLEGLGYGPERLAALNPRLVTTRVDAYGYTGPWAERRGFDSLVQMSTGIAFPAGGGKPTPLPAQALDHATGYLMAAATCRALVDGVREARLSLARTAKFLCDLGTDAATGQAEEDVAPFMERISTAWGPMRTIGVPGQIEGGAPYLGVDAGPLGAVPPRFSAR